MSLKIVVRFLQYLSILLVLRHYGICLYKPLEEFRKRRVSSLSGCCLDIFAGDNEHAFDNGPSSRLTSERCLRDPCKRERRVCSIYGKLAQLCDV